MGSPTPYRGAQIRTGDLSDPNGARYQAAPHPERAQGTRSAAQRAGLAYACDVARRDEIVAYANTLLEVERWPEFAPSGLQVIGSEEVALLVCGVSSSRTLFEHAAAEGANMVLVHHGLFWRNEPLVVDARLRGRLEALFSADASLLAYHLSLDAHPTLGNAAQLAAAIGLVSDGPFGGVGVSCTTNGLALDDLVARVEAAAERTPLVLAYGPPRIGRLAISTGAAGYDLIRAAHEGFDALLTGEPEEPNRAAAEELGIHLIAAGHHATERLGVQALAADLAREFGLDWRYLEVENPV